MGKRRLVSFIVLVLCLLLSSIVFAETTGAAVAETTFEEDVDKFFGEYVVAPVGTVFFVKIGAIVETIFKMPLVVAWLLFGAIFFTFKMGWVNFRMFGHAIALVRGKFDKPDSTGEVSSFQALASALSATVGLGNIAGVAIAVSIGGPGATFWMIVVGILGMSAKFAEVTLGQKYRVVREDGRIMGGAMYYLSQGLADIGRPALGKFLAVFFVVLCILGSFGGGNTFQVKQSLGQIETQIPWLAGIESQPLEIKESKELPQALGNFIDANDLASKGKKSEPIALTVKLPKSYSKEVVASWKKAISAVEPLTVVSGDQRRALKVSIKQDDGVQGPVIEGRGDSRGWVYGLVMVFLVGIVIIGGIRRIASVADKVVPTMCGVYVLACIYILLTNFGEIGGAFGLIFSSAFSGSAAYGGFVGVLVIGITRAVFSNEAGIGSAAIAHSAAKTEYPVQEGIVSLLEPFIDTVIICTMTALVIVITGAWDVTNPEFTELIKSKHGAALTSKAMESQVPWFSSLLAVAVFLFAYSTMISWSYYGERCWSYVFGDGSSMVYRLLFLTFTFFGSIITATNILDFSDLMILGMAFPNILGILFLTGKVKAALDDYWARYRAGVMTRVK